MALPQPPLLLTLILTVLIGCGVALHASAGSDHSDTIAVNGLEWALETNGEDIRWPDAIDYCEGLELAGQNDWRLPTMSELESVYAPDAEDGQTVRAPIRIDTCCLWSSESLVDRPAEDGHEIAGPPDRYHWGFMFDGGLEYYAVHIFEDGQALCVRDFE